MWMFLLWGSFANAPPGGQSPKREKGRWSISVNHKQLVKKCFNGAEFDIPPPPDILYSTLKMSSPSKEVVESDVKFGPQVLCAHHGCNTLNVPKQPHPGKGPN